MISKVTRFDENPDGDRVITTRRNGDLVHWVSFRDHDGDGVSEAINETLFYKGCAILASSWYPGVHQRSVLSLDRLNIMETTRGDTTTLVVTEKVTVEAQAKGPAGGVVSQFGSRYVVECFVKTGDGYYSPVGNTVLLDKMASGKKEIEDGCKELGIPSPFSRNRIDELGRLRRTRDPGVRGE